MKYESKNYWERQRKTEGQPWKFEKKKEEINLTVDQTVIFEWYRRYGQTQHCPACNARYVSGWGPGHAPACEYIKWLTATYPQYSIKSGKKAEPSLKQWRGKRRPRKSYRSEATIRKRQQ